MEVSNYVIYVKAVAIFLGGIALNLMVYSAVSPFWFVLNSHTFAHNPATRVLGLTRILEDYDPVNVIEMLKGQSRFQRGMLGRRKELICDRTLSVDDLDTAECGIDCHNIKLLGDAKIPCNHRPYSIPIPPPQRLVMSFYNKPVPKTNHDMMLHYGCEKRLNAWDRLRCPLGYVECEESRLESCRDEGTGFGNPWEEPACCVDESKVGDTTYNVTSTPSYVQVYGWALWQKPETRDSASNGTRQWCSVRDFRCATLTELESNGRLCLHFLCAAAGTCCLALFFTFRQLSVSNSIAICIFYATAGGLVLVGWVLFVDSTRGTLTKSMTPLDSFGRPFVHPMVGYENDNRTLIDGSAHLHRRKGEWEYYNANARVDFMTMNPEHSKGFQKLWGCRLGFAGGLFALASAVCSFELFCGLKGLYPFYTAVRLVCLVLFRPLKLMKGCIDNVLAPYPVLWVYPWQKLYPKAFTCGTWLPWPLDGIYDLGLMLPVHVIRALWDYISCQDICSPQEKSVLRSHGIHNDRLQSLLCSRRSYFVMMAGLGILNFMFNAESVIVLADQITHLRQAASQDGSYLWHRCSRQHGNCAHGVPDLVALNEYIIDMLVRIYSLIMEGVTFVAITKALIEWVGGFIGVVCACFALTYWTDFATSRRFCLIGWLFMMLTPVVTSSFSENRHINRAVVEDAIVQTTMEVYQEIRFFVSTGPCAHVQTEGEYVIERAKSACDKVTFLSYFMPRSAVDNCEEFYAQYGELRTGHLTNATALCDKALSLFEEHAKSPAEVEAIVRTHTPKFLNTVQVVVGLKAGVMNVRGIIPAVASMVPALMQGGLMVKNVVPRQTMPSILLTLPWAFTCLFWGQYQLFCQVLTGKLFLVASLAMSFCPLVYYWFGKLYTIVQPMDDQQSITMTFRIWYYALIFALILPYLMMVTYILVFNDFFHEPIWQAIVAFVTNPSWKEIGMIVAGTLSSYAYTLQAGIDWFVDEVVDHHVTGTAPAVIATSRSLEEAEFLQARLDTTLDLDSIQKGEYVCGGLGDPVRLKPPVEGEWSKKAQIYSVSLLFKDAATLDAFAAHIYGEDRIPMVLNKGRHEFLNSMERPPQGSFVWDERSAERLEQQARLYAEGRHEPMEMAAHPPQAAPATFGIGPIASQPFLPNGASYPSQVGSAPSRGPVSAVPPGSFGPPGPPASFGLPGSMGPPGPPLGPPFSPGDPLGFPGQPLLGVPGTPSSPFGPPGGPSGGPLGASSGPFGPPSGHPPSGGLLGPPSSTLGPPGSALGPLGAPGNPAGPPPHWGPTAGPGPSPLGFAAGSQRPPPWQNPPGR